MWRSSAKPKYTNVYRRTSITPFESIAVDSEGRDNSRSNEPFHHRHDLSLSKSERDLPRLIDHCSARGFQLQYSHCDKVYPQAYYGTCISANVRYPFSGMCLKDEYCVERLDPNVGMLNNNARSFCMNRIGWVSLGYTRVERDRYLELPPTDAGASSILAILMDLNGRLLINASSITIEEQETELVHKAPTLHTLPGGIVSCSDCSRIIVPSIIEGTQRALMRVVLPVNIAAATLLVTTFKN